MGKMAGKRRSESKSAVAGEKVGIIGVGSIGLCAARWCVERGYVPTAFEQSADVGGVWRANYDSLYTNSSRRMMNLSDLPWPFETESIFPSRAEVCRYYKTYMNHFDLEKYIKFNSKVESLEKRNGKWILRTKEEVFKFDKIMICSGKYWDKKLPQWAKMKWKNVSVSHSAEYKNCLPFKGKRVAVVGIGNSALDISLELARDPAVKEVVVCCRTGAVIMPTKDVKNGDPTDSRLSTRFYQYWLSSKERAKYVGSIIAKVNQEFRAHGLPAPTGGDFDPTSRQSNLKEAGAYIKELRAKRIQFKAGVVGVDDDNGQIELSNGERIGIDAVICCTGFRTNMDYLEPSVRDQLLQTFTFKSESGGTRSFEWIRLFKEILYPEDPSLCALGMITSYGNETCIGEVQARWVTAMWQTPKYSFEDQLKACEQKRQLVLKTEPRVSQFVRYVPYLDSLAKDLGAQPKWNKNETQLDLPLYHALNFKPVVSTQYRLEGLDQLDEAREILVSKL